MLEPAVKHIPAWKKLGLKLKFAKEEPDDANETLNHSAKSNKRRLSDDDPSGDAVNDNRAKKPKRPKLGKDRIAETASEEATNAIALSKDQVPAEIVSQSPTTKRKSVSFAPDTKTKDVKKPKKDKSKPKPSKKVKSSQGPKAQDPSKTTSPLSDHPALTYLHDHHNSPKTWKFSKSHQNYLLKHLFSFTHIPSSHDPALLSYLRGLQGSARSRTRKQALAIREEDEKWLVSDPATGENMENETDAQCLARRKRDYDLAVAHLKRQLREKEDEREEREWELTGRKQEWEQRLYKRRRAEVLLWGVGEDEDIVEDAVALSKQAIFGNSRPAASQPVTLQSRGMGGVEQISGSGIAKGSLAKKLRFDDDDEGVNKAGTVNEAPKMNGMKEVTRHEASNNVNGTRKRKRKKRTGVPDDDSSSSSEDEEEKSKPVPASKVPQKVHVLEESSEGSSSSDSDSSTNSNSDSDSD